MVEVSLLFLAINCEKQLANFLLGCILNLGSTVLGCLSQIALLSLIRQSKKVKNVLGNSAFQLCWHPSLVLHRAALAASGTGSEIGTWCCIWCAFWVNSSSSPIQTFIFRKKIM